MFVAQQGGTWAYQKSRICPQNRYELRKSHSNSMHGFDYRHPHWGTTISPSLTASIAAFVTGMFFGGCMTRCPRTIRTSAGISFLLVRKLCTVWDSNMRPACCKSSRKFQIGRVSKSALHFHEQLSMIFHTLTSGTAIRDGNSSSMQQPFAGGNQASQLGLSDGRGSLSRKARIRSKSLSGKISQALYRQIA